ncbi:hypothetical protein SK128_008422 [Halocaridina rubra]|uniref:ER-bound oxygenase mpaB/mpaB'/Rubber oxygenase catalytic domain-containing protein n=1 Tax=Halocaridina rubra TaxID=373956 RepID=A0AAN8WJC3_HALRR
MKCEGMKNATPNCPFTGSFIVTSVPPSVANDQELSPEKSPFKAFPYSSSTEEIQIDSTVQPSPRFMTLLEGHNVPGDCSNPPEPPPWFDKQLFDRGREFYRKYLFSLSFCDLVTLILMFSVDKGLKPLMYTGQSDTPQKALKRYFSTFLHILSWYKGDVWNPEDPSHKDIMKIRSVHNKIAALCNSSEENEKVANFSVSDMGHKEPSHPFYTAIQQDITPHAEANMTPKTTQFHFISQLDMCITQYTFIGLLVAHPEKLGAGGASEEEFAGLIHFWRGIGWLLGIDDKYNFCSGTVAETRALSLEIEHLIAIPFLSKASWNYEHMSRSLMSGMQIIIPNLTYPVMFRYLAHVLDLSIPRFVKRMSLHECFQYWMMRLLFGIITIFPSIGDVLSNRFRHMINILLDRSEKLEQRHSGTVILRKNYS